MESFLNILEMNFSSPETSLFSKEEGWLFKYKIKNIYINFDELRNEAPIQFF